MTPALFGIGTVEARRSYLIGPTAAGRVRKVAVDVGDAVKAGQLLAEMDPVDLDERLAALDASIARAGSAAAAAQAQRKDALAKQELAAINARRYVELGEQNFISAGAVEGKLQEQTSADAAVSGADANLAAARQDLQRLAAERAGLLQQRDNVRLLAPSDGVVISRDAEPGSTVVAGQAVLRLIDPSSLWVKVRFDQGRSAGLAPGLPAQIVLRSNPAAARRQGVARRGGQRQRDRGARRAGGVRQPARRGVGRRTGRGDTGAAAPSAGLAGAQRQHQAPGRSWRRPGNRPRLALDGDSLRLAPVRLGQSSLDGQVQVLDGLKAGDRVVVYSEKELAADSRIKVVDR